LERLKEAINQKLEASSGENDTTEDPRAAHTFAEKSNTMREIQTWRLHEDRRWAGTRREDAGAGVATGGVLRRRRPCGFYLDFSFTRTKSKWSIKRKTPVIISKFSPIPCKRETWPISRRKKREENKRKYNSMISSVSNFKEGSIKK
jgi:hypothetical protein